MFENLRIAGRFFRHAPSYMRLDKTKKQNIRIWRKE